MTFAVHVKNSIPLSRVREKTQVGLDPKFQKKFEGVDGFFASYKEWHHHVRKNDDITQRKQWDTNR